MNDDLISRQRIIDRLDRVISFGRKDSDGNHPISAELIRAFIVGEPHIRPEQKTGRWIEECGDLVCSKCKFVVSDPYYLGKAVACPNCGVKMEDDTDV